jgi:hypothetical protein
MKMLQRLPCLAPVQLRLPQARVPPDRVEAHFQLYRWVHLQVLVLVLLVLTVLVALVLAPVLAPVLVLVLLVLVLLVLVLLVPHLQHGEVGILVSSCAIG